MLIDLTWRLFEKTGNVDMFLEYCKLVKEKKGDGHGNKNKRSDN
jgi:hypothetical protein